ncbi:MAG: hypothetical protein K0U86_15810 [Planctomycetes bacterium]|nr:hypothetical protein [Planctomycetota bacterium]MCH9726367.1 hypothetical protein [Planctomycetota bacterium]MCH9775893.1 hypothetical protein [Planctomycetota bacterium]MCH9791300.1 hypothetical protein [Planctomycetota bacterium]MDF1746611.1 hypothetical protein [Gimesia sp.]
MGKPLHLAIFSFVLCVLPGMGCQMGGDGPISNTFGFSDLPKQSEPPVETEEEIETQESEITADE